MLEEATVLDDNIEELESFAADEEEEEMEDSADELDGLVIEEFDDSNALEDFAIDEARSSPDELDASATDELQTAEMPSSEDVPEVPQEISPVIRPNPRTPAMSLNGIRTLLLKNNHKITFDLNFPQFCLH